MNICPHPDCNKVMHGPNAILCPDHYFLLPADVGRSLIRMKIAATRTEDQNKRQHLERELQQNILGAIKRATQHKTKESNCVS